MQNTLKTYMSNTHTDAVTHEIKRNTKQTDRAEFEFALQYTITLTEFTSLSKINISSSNISTIDFIPFGIVQFNCSNNKLTVLPMLSSTLQVLDCSENMICGTIELPEKLTILRCSNNKIDNIVTVKKIGSVLHDFNVCPDDLIELNCHTNRFTKLPTFNKTLEYLFCENVKLKHISILPKQLKYVDFKIIKTQSHSYEIEWYGLMISVNETDIEQMNSCIKKNKFI